MDSLAANPAGSSSISGMPAVQNNGNVLDIVNNLKDREMQDFKNKANFMSDLSIKQDRLKSLFNPNDGWNPSASPSGQGGQGGQQPQQPQQMNTVFRDPNALSGYEKGELGIRQQGLNLDQQKMAQAGKMGEQALGIKQQSEQLAQQKSDQINAQKTADMQRKIDESGQKFAAAQAELDRKTKAGEDTLQAHKDLAAAVEERHKLELAQGQAKLDQKDAEFQDLKKQHQTLMDQAANSTVTKTDNQGNQITTKTSKGSTVNAIGKDGNTYTIPADKLNDMDSDGTPHWKPVGGGGQ